MQVIPRKREVVDQLLKSPLFARIADWEADRLLEQFGAELFPLVLDKPRQFHKQACLSVSKKKYIVDRATLARDVWLDYVFLTRQGMNPFAATKVAEAQGAGCRFQIEARPYQMLFVPGVDFADVDPVALSFGVNADDPARLRHGADYYLREIQSSGHTCLPEKALIHDISQKLAVAPDLIREIVSKKLTQKRWMAREVEDTRYISDQSVFRTERYCAQRIATLLARPERGVTPQALPDKLNKAQRQAVERGLNSGCSIITGGPGTGKTTVLDSLIHALREAGERRIVLAAPTGKAAQRITEQTGEEATTIHQMLESHPERGFRRNEGHPLDGDVVILDEVSMIDLDLLRHVLAALPAHARLVMVGDSDQLPSIGAGAVLRDLIESQRVDVTRLNRVYRTRENSEILTAAHEIIRHGEVPMLREDGHDFLWIEESNDQAIAQRIREFVEKDIPNHFDIPLENIQVLTPQHRTACGVESLNKALQPIMNPNSVRREATSIQRKGRAFSVGEKVMQTVNDHSLGINNGEIGTITSINKQKRQVGMDFGDRQMVVPAASLSKMTFAYATTIHKSQGSEYDAVVMPVSTRHAFMLSPRLLYTGITRGKKLVVMVGSRNALEKAMHNSDRELRHTMLTEHLKDKIPTPCRFVDCDDHIDMVDEEGLSNTQESDCASPAKHLAHASGFDPGF